MPHDAAQPDSPATRHVPVLTAEVLAALDVHAGDTVLDCTAGLGGHAALLAHRLGARGTLVLNDADEANLTRAEAHVRAALAGASGEAPAIVALRGNFADAPRKLVERSLSADAVLADLGFSSSQMDDAGRGLSFSRPGPLDMRFDRTSPVTAATLVNTLGERELEEILRDYGEEREARRVAQRIVRARAEAPIETTDRLAGVVREALGQRARGQRIDPATRAFQALRIAVNDELGSLASLLESVARAANSLALPGAADARPTWLRAGARVAVISFHSLEDRPVKRTFADLIARGLARPSPADSRQPLVASEGEQEANPRSRSAKLRAVALGGQAARFGASDGQRPKV